MGKVSSRICEDERRRAAHFSSRPWRQVETVSHRRDLEQRGVVPAGDVQRLVPILVSLDDGQERRLCQARKRVEIVPGRHDHAVSVDREDEPFEVHQNDLLRIGGSKFGTPTRAGLQAEAPKRGAEALPALPRLAFEPRTGALVLLGVLLPQPAASLCNGALLPRDRAEFSIPCSPSLRWDRPQARGTVEPGELARPRETYGACSLRGLVEPEQGFHQPTQTRSAAGEIEFGSVVDADLFERCDHLRLGGAIGLCGGFREPPRRQQVCLTNALVPRELGVTTSDRAL